MNVGLDEVFNPKLRETDVSLRVDDLSVYYRSLQGDVSALDGVSFEIGDVVHPPVHADEALPERRLAAAGLAREAHDLAVGDLEASTPSSACTSPRSDR